LNINPSESSLNANLHDDLDSLENPENTEVMHAHHRLGSFFTRGDVNKNEHILQTEMPMIFYSPISSSDELETYSIDNLESLASKEKEEENFLRSKEMFNDPNSMSFVSEIEDSIPIFDHESKSQLKSPMELSSRNKMLLRDSSCEDVSSPRD
jgi:hypothetical protein